MHDARQTGVRRRRPKELKRTSDKERRRRKGEKKRKRNGGNGRAKTGEINACRERGSEKRMGGNKVKKVEISSLHSVVNGERASGKA